MKSGEGIDLGLRISMFKHRNGNGDQGQPGEELIHHVTGFLNSVYPLFSCGAGIFLILPNVGETTTSYTHPDVVYILPFNLWQSEWVGLLWFIT